MAHDPLPKPNIVSVFEHFGINVLGRDTGGWRKAECPLPEHDDRNPSASINEDACRWHCHTCSRGGDAIDLIMEVEGVGFADAKRLAAELAGEGDGVVRGEQRSSGLLPRKQGHRPGGRVSAAPWLRF